MLQQNLLHIATEGNIVLLLLVTGVVIDMSQVVVDPNISLLKLL